MSTIKKLTHNTGKVEISSKWIDPTLDYPIQRTLQRGESLWTETKPINPLRDKGNYVKAVVILAYVVLLGQAAGWIPS